MTSIRARFPRILIQYPGGDFSHFSSARPINLTSRDPELNADNIARYREKIGRVAKKPPGFFPALRRGGGGPCQRQMFLLTSCGRSRASTSRYRASSGTLRLSLSRCHSGCRVRGVPPYGFARGTHLPPRRGDTQLQIFTPCVVLRQ